jgi:hypothetical protein
MVGTKRDRHNRIKLARVDDERCRFMVTQARNAIYQKNYAVDSAPVERILKPQSLVPTSVRLFNFGLRDSYSEHSSIECLL